MSHIRSHIMVCTGTGCTSSDSPKLITAFEEELKLEGMDQEVRVVKTGCFGLCAMGPIVMVFPEGACYTRVTVDDVHEIVAEHIVKGRIVTRLLHMEGEAGQSVTSLSDTQFYKHQLRIALRNCGVINPESIDEYIGMDGYTALERILTEKTPPQEIIDALKKSGLRGRGGAGFPTGQKWQFTHDAVSPDGVKFVCCNADEGDPGAFMDRSVLEGDPHVVLEAMAIAGASREETAMVGDKLLTDVLGARRSGVLALMVEPLGGPVGTWNRVLHALQEPFKQIAKRRNEET